PPTPPPQASSSRHAAPTPKEPARDYTKHPMKATVRAVDSSSSSVISNFRDEDDNMEAIETGATSVEECATPEESRIASPIPSSSKIPQPSSSTSYKPRISL